MNEPIVINFETEILEKLNLITEDRVFFNNIPQSQVLTSGEPKILMQNITTVPISHKDDDDCELPIQDTNTIIFTIIGINYAQVKGDERLLRNEMMRLGIDCISHIQYEGSEYVREADAEVHTIIMTYLVTAIESTN